MRYTLVIIVFFITGAYVADKYFAKEMMENIVVEDFEETESLGAPVSNLFRNLLPETNQTYDLGSTTPSAEWLGIYTKDLFISGTCTGCGTTDLTNYISYTAATSTLFTLNGGLIETASSTFSADLHSTNLYASSTSAFSDMMFFKAPSTGDEVIRIERNAGTESFDIEIDSNGDLGFFQGTNEAFRISQSNSDINPNGDIVWIGDTDTFIDHSADLLDIQAGGLSFLRLVEDTTDTLTFNNGNSGINFEWDSQSLNASMVFTGATGLLTVNEGIISTASSSFSAYLNAQELHASSTSAFGGLSNFYGGLIAASSSIAGDFTVGNDGMIRLIPFTSCGTTPNERGEGCLDDSTGGSGGQLIFATSTTPQVYGQAEKSIFGFSLASTSQPFATAEGFASGKILVLPPRHYGFQINKIHCSLWGGTSVALTIGDSSGNNSETITINTSTSTEWAILTNNSFTSGEGSILTFGSISGSPDYMSCNLVGTTTPE